MMLLSATGVGAPQDDTALLSEALHAAEVPQRARVLDIGSGAGTLALAAMRAGAAEATAADVSWCAVWTARANEPVRRLPVRVRQGDVLGALPGPAFDLVLSNAPGALADPLCARVFDLLAPGGVFLMIHSALSGVDRTIRRLRGSGLRASVVRRDEELVVIRGDRPERAQGDDGPERADAR